MLDPNAPYPFTAETWPIAAAMLQYPNLLPDGSSVQDQPAEAWADALADIVDAGFTEVDPTDSWLRVADLSPSRLDEFQAVVREAGLTIPGITTARRSIIDPEHGEANRTVMEGWLEKHGALCVKAANQLQPLWSQPRVKVAQFTDAFAAASNRVKAICEEIGIKAPDAASAS